VYSTCQCDVPRNELLVVLSFFLSFSICLIESPIVDSCLMVPPTQSGLASVAYSSKVYRLMLNKKYSSLRFTAGNLDGLSCTTSVVSEIDDDEGIAI
jgi:hypothetical protein